MTTSENEKKENLFLKYILKKKGEKNFSSSSLEISLPFCCRREVLFSSSEFFNFFLSLLAIKISHCNINCCFL